MASARTSKSPLKGIRFQKRISLGKGFHLNVSKTGLSLSFGIPGLSVNLGKNGLFVNGSLPGTGVSKRIKLGKIGQLLQAIAGRNQMSTEAPKSELDRKENENVAE